MRTEYLIGFIEWLEREHDISLTREAQSDYGDGQSTVHHIDEKTVESLAKQYTLRQHVMISTEIENDAWSPCEECGSGNESTRYNLGSDYDALQQRLNVAEQRVQRMVDCSKGQDSVATGYLSDILTLLKPAAEV